MNKVKVNWRFVYDFMCVCIFLCWWWVSYEKNLLRVFEKVFIYLYENGMSRNYMYFREFGIVLEYWLNIFLLFKNLLRYRIVFKY